MPKSPLFIVGAHRSGTTEVLAACQRLLGYVGGVEGYVWQSLMTLDAHFTAVLAELGGEDQPGLRGFSLVNIGRKPLVSAWAEQLMALHRSLYGEGPAIDKTPGVGMVLACPIIKAFVPSAHFIFMKRNGIENVASRMRQFPTTSFAYACSAWAKTMEGWVTSREQLEGDYIEVDQRRLLKEPHDIAAELTAFLGGGNALDLGRFFAKSFAEQTDKSYRTYTSPGDTGWGEAEYEIFTRVCGPMMMRFGYAFEEWK